MAKKKIISLSIDTKVYEEFSARCREEGMVISRRVEKFMEESMQGASDEKKHN